MFQAEVAVMNTSVNTAIDVVAGSWTTTPNNANTAKATTIAAGAIARRSRSRLIAPARRRSRTVPAA